MADQSPAIVLTEKAYQATLRQDLASFTQRCFHELPHFLSAVSDRTLIGPPRLAIDTPESFTQAISQGEAKWTFI